MARENPPRGYDSRDFPLPHRFIYDYMLELGVATKNSTMQTYMRTTKKSADPATIPVNPRNSAYAIETGPTICFDSIVAKMTISKLFTLTELAKTDNIGAVKFHTMKIMGAWEDDYTAIDEDTSETIQTILELTMDATNEDVTPKYATNLIGTTANHPVSNLVDADEAFGDWNLDTNLVMEGVAFNADTMFNALRFFTNGGKLKTLMGKYKTHILSQNRLFSNVFENKFVPKKVQFGVPAMYFGELVHIPLSTEPDQVVPTSQGLTGGGYLSCKTIVSFNEWNKEFDQRRM